MLERFRIGEKLFYPKHGPVVVEHIGTSPIMGQGDDYYHLRLLVNDCRMVVPIRNAERVGLRRLYSRLQMSSVMSGLSVEFPRSPDGNRDRYKKNLLRMDTGRLEDVADIIRCYFWVTERKTLSFRERKLYDKAKYQLVAELAIINHVPEPIAEDWVMKALEAGRRSGAQVSRL